MPHPFQLVDVFGDSPFSGNPLAVVADADGLDTDTMQRITRWLNLSETAFLLRPANPEADYRVRIFTLERELPFAGHPTLGACHGWLTQGGTPRHPDRIVQECGAGLVTIRHEAGTLAFAAPPLIRSGPVEEDKLAEVAAVLGIARADIVEARWIDNGPGWIGVLLPSAEAVLALRPARAHPTRIDIGVVGPYPAGGPLAFELRAIFSDQHGALIEDPVTGSLNASAAQWMLETGRATAPYLASQGGCIGRTGRIHIDRDGEGRVWIGGRTETLFAGESGF